MPQPVTSRVTSPVKALLARASLVVVVVAVVVVAAAVGVLMVKQVMLARVARPTIKTTMVMKMAPRAQRPQR